MYKQIIFLAVLATSQAQLVTNGSCDFLNLQIQTSNDLPPQNLFEISRISNSWQKGQCASWSFSENSTNIIMTEVVNRTLVHKNGSVTSNNNLDAYNIHFEDFSTNFTFLGWSSEYLVAYACSNNGEQKDEYIWVLGNTTVLSPSARNETNDILTKNKFEGSTLVGTSHSTEDCRTGAAANLKISSFIILLVGIAISKGLLFN